MCSKLRCVDCVLLEAFSRIPGSFEEHDRDGFGGRRKPVAVVEMAETERMDLALASTSFWPVALRTA